MSKLADKVFFVLVADDSEPDRFMLKTALRQAARLQISAEVDDGAQTISFLKGHGCFRDREKFPFPDLLLLDLKMPRLDGFEVLEWLRRQRFGNLTVVVLTDSMEPEDIKHALDLGADLFQVKPRTHHEWQTMVRALEEVLVNTSSKAPHLAIPSPPRAVPEASARIY